jgi:hypothetical protein
MYTKAHQVMITAAAVGGESGWQDLRHLPTTTINTHSNNTKRERTVDWTVKVLLLLLLRRQKLLLLLLRRHELAGLRVRCELSVQSADAAGKGHRSGRGDSRRQQRRGQNGDGDRSHANDRLRLRLKLHHQGNKRSG